MSEYSTRKVWDIEAGIERRRQTRKVRSFLGVLVAGAFCLVAVGVALSWVLHWVCR